MHPFNIVDGLNEIFDDTCTKQVVSRLIRNPIIWNFLGEPHNFNFIQKTLGDDPARWSITGVIEAAAGLPADGHQQNDSRESADPVYFMTEIDSLCELSALSLRVRDYIAENSLVHWLENLPYQTASEVHLWNWTAILSMNLPGFDRPLEAFVELTSDKNIPAIKLLAYTVHSDQIISDYLIDHLDAFCTQKGLSQIVALINSLDFLGDFDLSKVLAEKSLRSYLSEKPPQLMSGEKFDELLRNIAENRNLIILAKKAESETILEDLQIEGKILLSELLNRSGISNYDPAIFEGNQNLVNEESSQDAVYIDLQEEVDKANSFVQTDVDSARSIAKGIYQKIKRTIQKNGSNLGIPYSLRHEIIDLLQTCNLIVESADLIEKFVIDFPDDIHLLRIASILFHKYGAHAKAVRSFQLLNVVESLSREEKVHYSDSLAYVENFHQAYEVRATTNILDLEDIRKILVYSFYAGLNDEMDKILKLHSKELREWPLTELFSQEITQNGNQVTQVLINIWSRLTNNEDRVLFIDVLEKTNHHSLVSDLLDETLNTSSEFSELTIKLIRHYQKSGNTSTQSEKLSSFQLNHPISQKDFEEGINLFLQNGLIKKASQWLNQFDRDWLLSPEKRLLQAEISLHEGDYSNAEQLLHEEISDQEASEKTLTLYSLAILNSNPNRFPIDINKEKINRLKGMGERYKEIPDPSDITLKILKIYLNDQDRIGLFEKELSRENKHDAWRIKAAVGNEYFNRGRFDLAIQYYKEVERILPFDLVLLRNLLECYLRLKLTDEAEIVLHRLLAAEGLTWKELITLSFDQFLSEDWKSFLYSQLLKFPDCKEIQLLFSLSSYRNDDYTEAVESIKKFLVNPDLNVDEKLIAVQILVACGDRGYAERILEILLSGSENLPQFHYLTAAVIYQSLGNFSKALVMVNHIQLFNPVISSVKLDLLLKNGNYAEAADHLLHLKPGTEFAFSHSSDIPLIDSSSWTKFIDDPSIFEKTAANVWIANKNLSSAIEILEDGLSRDSNDEQLAYMLLEIAKLTNRTDILDDVLRFSEVREIHSTELICSMAESALIRRQEVLAARYLSTIFDSTENQPRIKALQSILLKHNGNFTEANLIYNDLKKELDLRVKSSLITSTDTTNQFWLTFLMIEMEDYSNALEICRVEIEKYGQSAGLANAYLEAILGLKRKNVLFEKLNCSSQIMELSDEQLSLFRQIKQEFSQKSPPQFDFQVLRVCNFYVDQEFLDLNGVLEVPSDRIDLRNLVYISLIQNGHEKTDLEFSAKLKDSEDLIFFAALLVDEDPEKSLRLITDHINLLSDNPIHLALLAKIHYLLKNYSEAYAAITLALNIEPSEYGWEILAGEICQKRGEMIAAIEHFERANGLSRKSSHKEQLRDLHILTGSEQAIPIMESKLADDPGNSDLALKIASLCANFNKPGKAVHYYKMAIQWNPKDHQAYTGLSRLSAQIGNLEKAMEYADKGLILHERDFDLLLLKTDLMKRTRGFQATREFLENRILLDDGIDSDLQALLADLIYEMNGMDECLAFLASKSSHQSLSVNFLTTHVKYLLIAGDTIHAKEILERTLNEYPTHAEVNALMGECFRIQGELDQAIGHYLRAINLDKLNEKYFIHLFEIYNVQRDSETAAETLKSGMKTIPYSVDLPIRLAKFYLQNGLIDKANEMIERALRLRPHEEEANAIKDLINNQRSSLKNEFELITN